MNKTSPSFSIAELWIFLDNLLVGPELNSWKIWPEKSMNK
jgi:hypothetical protein